MGTAATAVQDSQRPATGSGHAETERGADVTISSSPLTVWWRSSLGLKLLVAITGVVLFLFVIGHLLGNLQIFRGPAALNSYSEKLRALPILLWGARLGILVCAILHVFATLSLALLNRRARPIPYSRRTPVQATVSSRTMVYSGLLVLAYVGYHLAQFTWKITNPAISHLLNGQGKPDVYAMVVLSFRNRLVSGSYIIAMIVLGFHLNHGLASIFQTVGWMTPRNKRVIERIAFWSALIIVAGYIAIPLSVLLGLVPTVRGGM
ncbi:MAG: succinate dehydrogenase cytochrome b subunit [candidate division Zixibacteria bacterium]|nr:succinate dehydrogenase cytochrome b subunit [candidate division Zixibacteria bacterium]